MPKRFTLLALLVFMYFPTSLFSQQINGSPNGLKPAQIPLGTGYNVGQVFSVGNGASATDCSVGGGTTAVVCLWNGSAWTALGSGTLSMPLTFSGASTVPTGASLSATGSGTIVATSTTGNAATASNLIGNPTLPALGGPITFQTPTTPILNGVPGTCTASTNLIVFCADAGTNRFGISWNNGAFSHVQTDATATNSPAVTYTAGGTTYFNAASLPNGGAAITATHATGTTFTPQNLLTWGSYQLEIDQDLTGSGGIPFTLGITTGGCGSWSTSNGGGGAITLSTAPSSVDLLTWTLDSNNICLGKLTANYTGVTNVFGIPNAKSKACGGTSPCTSTAFSSALTNPSILFVIASETGSSAMSVSSDTGSHTWHDCGPGLVAGSTGSIECWYALNTGTTASETITVTAGGSIYPMTTWEVTGAATSNPIDGGSGGGYSDITIAYSGSIGANNMSAASITPVTNGDLILTMFSPASGTITPGTLPNAFTNIGSTGYGVSYFFQSVTASIQATAGLSASGVAYSNITVAVKP